MDADSWPHLALLTEAEIAAARRIAAAAPPLAPWQEQALVSLLTPMPPASRERVA